MKNVIVLGGGSGMSVVLEGLRQYSHNLHALVPMIAHGGSTGRLRDDLGIHPVGTLRQTLLALSRMSDIEKKAANYRFEEGELKGHSAGNIYLAVFEKVTGNLQDAIDIAHEKWGVEGKVVPLTSSAVDICINLDNGDLICGEHNVNKVLFDKSSKITGFFLDPAIDLAPQALESIENADVMIFGPGDLYFLLSSFLVQGFTEAVKKSSAKKIFISNITNREGLTTNFKLKDYIRAIEQYTGEGFLDYVVYNTKELDKEMEEKAIEIGETFVTHDSKTDLGVTVVEADLLCSEMRIQNGSDFVYRSYFKHDETKIAHLINEIINGSYE